MKVAVVRPPTVFSSTEPRPGACPPLGLAYLAASLRQAGHAVVAIDAVGEGLNDLGSFPSLPWARRQGLRDDQILARFEHDIGLICVSCMFSTEWPLAKRLIHRLRNEFPSTPIVVGGEHVTACPEFILNDCGAVDCCGLGEGEVTVVELANALERGEMLNQVGGIALRGEAEVVYTTPRGRVKDIDSLPWPAWDLFPIRNYIDHGVTPGVDIGRSMPLLASRGCPFECTFCSNPAMWGRTWKPRNQADVLAEMKHYLSLYGATNFDFYDLTAIVRKDWTLKMAQMIVEDGLSITWQLPSGTRSEALDDEVLVWLYRSGCRHIIYAPESGSSRTLHLIKKKISKDAMTASVRSAVRSGIKTKANFIVGFPDETLLDVFKSYCFALRLAYVGLHDLSFFPFSAYPGSALFDRLKRAGVVELNDEYFFSLIKNPRSYSQHLPTRLIPLLRYIGLLLFYSISFLLRPLRVVQLVRALWTKTPETRLESALLRLYKNFQVKSKPVEW